MHFTGLKPPPSPPECNGDCDALEEGSVTHQIKGEDGAMTGIQQVRPTLFHVFLFIFFQKLYFLMLKNEYVSDFLTDGDVCAGVFPVAGREWLS